MTAVSVHVLSVECDADAIAEQLGLAGFTVSGPAAVDLAKLSAAIRGAPGADAVCVVAPLGARSSVADALDGLFEGRVHGYGQACRAALDGAAAMLCRAEAGTVGGRLVFSIPSDAETGQHATGLLAEALMGLDPIEEAEPIPFGGARPGMGLSLSENREPEPTVRASAPQESDDGPAEPPWKRAIRSLGAELLIGRSEPLPEAIEKLAPVLNVLHTAGESGMMKLPSGRRYSVWGWPDLRRPNSKVLAVSWGSPLAEVVALHRHPGQAGTCIQEDNGLLPSAGADVAETCVRICGRAPADTSGMLFAVSSDTVWILRGRRVFKWDGSREKDDGNPKQVLSSLTLFWSNR